MTIRGEMFFPEGFTAKATYPVMILSHGFMSDKKECFPYAKEYIKDGYVTVTFDFCGGGRKSKSDGKTTQMSVDTEIADLEAVIEYVKTLPYADETNITLIGCSQGGFVSAITAAKHKDEIKALILYYPALCIPDSAREGKLLGAEFDPDNIPELLGPFFMRYGRIYAVDAKKYDPYKEMAEYEGPVLIVHGTKDIIVDPVYAKRGYDCYVNCSRRKLLMIEDANHGLGKKGIPQAVAATREFLTEV